MVHVTSIYRSRSHHAGPDDIGQSVIVALREKSRGFTQQSSHYYTWVPPPNLPRPNLLYTMSAPFEDSQGEPSSSSAPDPPPTSSSSTTLPPIAAFYDFITPPSTASTGPDLSRSPPPAPVLFPPSTAEDNLSWITPANTAELAEDDDIDNDYYDDTNFVFENGRRYHANADGRVLYPLPNDESEQERDDMKHKLALWMMHEKLFYAPVDENLTQGGMVFDLGESIHPLSRSVSSPFLSPPPQPNIHHHGFQWLFPHLPRQHGHFAGLRGGIRSIRLTAVCAHYKCLHRCRTMTDRRRRGALEQGF